MSGGEQVSPDQGVGLDVVEVEGDSVVFGGDRRELAGPDLCRDVGDLVAALFTFRDAPAQPGERRFEGQLDVVRLQPSGAGLVHRRAQLLQVGFGQMLRGQGTFFEQFFQPFGHLAVDDLVHLGLHLWLIAVADGLEQQIPQRGLVIGGGIHRKAFRQSGQPALCPEAQGQTRQA